MSSKVAATMGKAQFAPDYSPIATINKLDELEYVQSAKYGQKRYDCWNP